MARQKVRPMSWVIERSLERLRVRSTRMVTPRLKEIEIGMWTTRATPTSWATQRGW